MKKKWRFVSNGNGEEIGFNDPGIEIFSANSIPSMVREVLQNSIDQRVDPSQPVYVEFEIFEVRSDKIPGMKDLKDSFRKCIKAASGDPAAEAFFNQALEKAEQPVRVLRISDFNTTGLVGAETGEKGTPWHSLVKARGSSNKNMVESGGSFGIGKAAPIACSYFHTIFYASKVESITSYIGVSRLMSFEDKDAFGKTFITSGTGFYSSSEKLNAILHPFVLSNFRREENGTDIYILALEDIENIEDTICFAVLKNFFISIKERRLSICVGKRIIDENTIAADIYGLEDNVKKNAELKVYYDLLRYAGRVEDWLRIPLNAEEYGRKYDIDDEECELLLVKGEELNRRILMTRKTGMTLFSQGNISGSISFSGILRITGENMNRIFKAMEMPAHDAWEPGRCKVNKKFYKNAYDDLRCYLRNKVQEVFGHAAGDMESAYDMDEFFGDYAEEDISEVELTKRKPKVTIRRNKISRKKKEVPIQIVEDPAGDPFVEKPIKNPKKPSDKMPIEGKRKEYHFRAVEKVLRATDMMHGVYELSFCMPTKKKSVLLEFKGIAEKCAYKIPLQSIKVDGLSESHIEVRGYQVFLKGLKKGSNVFIRFKTGLVGPMMLGVDYYEA